MRVMTYNIRAGLGTDGRRDLARIAEVVAAEGPDIVCFQEVHRWLPWSGWGDQPRRLRRLLGRPFIFGASVRYGLGGFGLGIATHYPLCRVRRWGLPSVRESRSVLEVAVETPDGPVSVLCTHWGLRQDERARQARAVADRLRRLNTPVILCADLNDRPEADYVKALLAETGLHDCGSETGQATYPSDTPTARIDVVFASPVLRLRRLSVIASDASDHRPVVADLEWIT